MLGMDKFDLPSLCNSVQILVHNMISKMACPLFLSGRLFYWMLFGYTGCSCLEDKVSGSKPHVVQDDSPRPVKGKETTNEYIAFLQRQVSILEERYTNVEKEKDLFKRKAVYLEEKVDSLEKVANTHANVHANANAVDDNVVIEFLEGTTERLEQRVKELEEDVKSGVRKICDLEARLSGAANDEEGGESPGVKEENPADSVLVIKFYEDTVERLEQRVKELEQNIASRMSQ